MSTAALTESERMWLASEACKAGLEVVGTIAGPHGTKASEYWREKLTGLREGAIVDVRLNDGRVIRSKLSASINKVQAYETCWVNGIVGSYATGRVRPQGGWDREIKRTARAVGGGDV